LGQVRNDVSGGEAAAAHAVILVPDDQAAVAEEIDLGERDGAGGELQRHHPEARPVG
jgi:hypothetical protein